MTWLNTRIKPGEYACTHVESKRQFHLNWLEMKYEWRVLEEGKKEPIKLSLEPVTAKRDVLILLDEFVKTGTTSKLVVQKKVIEKRQTKKVVAVLPQSKGKSLEELIPTIAEYQTLGRTAEGAYIYQFKGHKPVFYVSYSDENYWRATEQGGGRQPIATGMFSKKDCLREITWYIGKG